MINNYPIPNYFSNKNNRDYFLKSLQKVYGNPEELYNRIVSINTIVFILSKDKETIGYLFFNDSGAYISIDSKKVRCVYNGFAFINEQFRNNNYLKELLAESMKYFKNKYKKTIVFAVTSNPIALNSYYKAIPNICPSLTKEYSKKEKEIASQLKNILNTEVNSNENPFVLKTKLPQRYNEKMRKELENINTPENQFLKKLEINEQIGDRFLFFWEI